MLGLLVQAGQRVRVGGVAGLGPLGLRHLQLVEQHHLQLLGRAEVDLLVDDLERVLLGVAHPRREARLLRGQQLRVDRDADRLQVGQDALQRQLDLRQQARAAGLLQRHVQRVGQLGDRPGAHDLRLRDLRRVALLTVQKRQLALLGLLLHPQLPLEVAQHQVVERERALARAHQVRGELGVRGEPGQRPAVVPDRVQRPLHVVGELGHLLVGQPCHQRPLVALVQRGDVDVRARAVHERDRHRAQLDRLARRAGRRVAERQADPRAGGRVLGQPGGQLPRLERAAADLEAVLGLRLGRGQLGEQPVAQHPELQLVEQPVHGVAVPLLPGQVVGRDAQLHVLHQLGELAVHHHVRQVLAQLVADLALDLVDPVDSSSSEPNSLIHLATVFSPTPGIFGRLSDGSPRRAA